MKYNLLKVKETMTETLHIYTRVSTTTQEEEGTSLETQLEEGVKRSKKLKFKHKLWNEGGKSSSKDDLLNRPVLLDLLQEIDEGNVKHLYVWNTDRLSRNIQTWGMIRFKLIKNDVRLHTPTGEQQLSDPQTNLMLGIMSEFSQYDNQLRTERFRLGKIKKIKEGGWMGGPPPFGYKIVESRLVPHEEEKKWVKTIFESFRDGQSLDQIRYLLLQNGVMTRRKRPVWSHGSINALLRNTHYGGYYLFTDKKSGEVVRVNCDPILPPSLVKEVSECLKQRSYSKGGKRSQTSNQKHIYLLRDLMVCGHCGSKFTGNIKSKQTSYYSCSNRVNNFKNRHTDKEVICSSNRNLRLLDTDRLVWDKVVKIVSQSNLFKEDIKVSSLGNSSHQKSKVDTKKLRNRLQKIEREIDNISNTIVTLETDKLIKSRNVDEVTQIIKNVEEHRISLEGEREKLTDQLLRDREDVKWKNWIKEFSQRIDELNSPSFSTEDKRNFLEGIISEITVTNTDIKTHELDISFKFPYVGDKIIWKNENKKSDGYKIQSGRKSSKVILDLLKK